MITLKLFNGVLSKYKTDLFYISQDGYIIEPGAFWAKDKIIEYYSKEKLNGNDLNKTFHKSWSKIKESSRFELCLEQIQHYISTCDSNFQDEIYIPDEILYIPETKLCFKVIKAYTRDELVEKSINLLKSGIALKEETIHELLSLLTDTCNYNFTGDEGIKNKEATTIIADIYGVVPKNVIEFFRYIIYKSTNEALLIKNEKIIELIKESNFNPSVQFTKFGLENLASIFNRFKPLFLAFKNKCPGTINKISKLSKIYHKPLAINELNFATSSEIINKHWLDNATIYSLFKALSACHSTINGQNCFVYRIRNGKSWVHEKQRTKDFSRKNFNIIMEHIIKNFSMAGKKFYLPKGVRYALPTSEKMFVGNIPTGTKFYGKKLAIGIYWKNTWGAKDLDLSAINIGGKVGWNSSYNQNNGKLMYSGDIRSAPNGAVEYLYAANKKMNYPSLIQNNVYSGSETCDYKIIIGKGSKITKNYMMNPNNVVEVKCKSVQTQTILGILIPENEKQSFVLLNFGAGHLRVSKGTKFTDTATKALFQQWKTPVYLETILKMLSATIVDNPSDADIDLSLDKLEKDSFIKLFERI